MTGGTLSWGWKKPWGMHVIPYIEFQGAQWFWNSLNSSNCFGFFWYWKCTWKNLFRLHFRLPRLDFPFVIKCYFNSAQGNLNNRPSHHVTVGPNWSWMYFSKLLYLLAVFWPTITTPDHFPVFQNEKDSEAGTAPFVVYICLEFIINGACILRLFYFLIFAYFYDQCDWYDNHHQLYDCKS